MISSMGLIKTTVLLVLLPQFSESLPGDSVPVCTLGQGAESHIVGGNASGTVWPWQIYQSSPFNPPELQITSNGEPLAPGLLLITPSNFKPENAIEEAGPIIMTDKGQLVWNGPSSNATNFRVAKFEGKDILTFWNGFSTDGANIGHGYGNVTFLDSSYNTILTVCPRLGLVAGPGGTEGPCEADLHESFITDRDTIIVTAYNATPADLSALGGSTDGWVFDCLFYEIEPRNGTILFNWSALEHVSVGESKQPLGSTGNESVPFDFFHINSVVNIGHSYLVNSRHYWSTYLVSAKGDIEWTLQGDTGGDFGPLPANGHFSWQHHARPHQVSKSSLSISYFNNYNSFGVANGTNPTNGLELKLSLPPNKAHPPVVLEHLSDPADPIYADSQGSTQFLPNGNIFMDFGEIAVLKEFGKDHPSGNDVRWTARFGADNLVQSYRGYKQVWHATPKTPPSLVLERRASSGCCSTGYVSWNGATDVDRWQIHEGPSGGSLSLVGTVGYMGFETKFTVGQTCVQAVAMTNGRAVGTSNVACTH